MLMSSVFVQIFVLDVMVTMTHQSPIVFGTMMQ